MKIELEVSEENEGTDSPWWVIIDPHQNFHTNERGIHNIASMITGPFFSRESAEKHIELRRYNFSDNVIVYCLSGYWSNKYKQALRKACGR